MYSALVICEIGIVDGDGVAIQVIQVGHSSTDVGSIVLEVGSLNDDRGSIQCSAIDGSSVVRRAESELGV